MPSKAVWGRLTNALSGRVYKLRKTVVSVGRREANEADILVCFEWVQCYQLFDDCNYR